MDGNGKPYPRRPIEREYLGTLNDVVSLDRWRVICEKAAEDAQAGNPRARDWLARWLMATESRPLTVLAAEEASNGPRAAAEDEVETERRRIAENRQLLDVLHL